MWPHGGRCYYDHGFIATKIKEREKRSYWTEVMGDKVTILCEISGFCGGTLESSLRFWCVTQLWLTVRHRRCGTKYWSNLQDQSIFLPSTS